MLYLTNLAAIILVGALVVLLTGFAPRGEVVRRRRRIRVGLVAAGVGVIVVSVPLAVQTRQVISGPPPRQPRPDWASAGFPGAACRRRTSISTTAS